jgi:hypothetical protein
MLSQNSRSTPTVEDILKYDPLVSDTACQNRAVFFVALARRLQEGYALNKNGYIEKEITDISCVPENPDPKKDSNNARKKLISQSKKVIAERTLDYLKNNCKIDFAGVYQYFCNKEVKATFSLDSYKIPILPIYITAKMLMQYVTKNGVPFIVNFKRIVMKDGNEISDGQTRLTYLAPDKLKLVESLVPVKKDIPIIATDIFCILKPENKSTFLAEKEFNDCLVSFKKLDISFLVMLIAAAHTPYTKTTQIPDEDPMKALAPPDEKLDITAINLDVCSSKEFEELRGTASRLGLFKQSVFIDHVYASTSTRVFDLK